MVALICLVHSHTHLYTHKHFHSEESPVILGVGVDKLMECGKLDHLKNGPIYWVDSADINPCMGEVIGLYHVSTVQKKRFWLNAVHSAFPSFRHYFSTPPPFPSSSP